MTEYQEAISRLNIQERTPGVTISRSQFPIERKDTPWNYDRILRETLNTPLPKYSIPQRLFINADGSKTYTFPLDKQFTLAKGGRKSIAIREVKLDKDSYITGNTYYIPDDYYRVNVTGILEYKTTAAQQWTQWNMNFYFDFQINHEFPITTYYTNLASEVSTRFNNAINTQLGTQNRIYANSYYSDKGFYLVVSATANGYNFRFGDNIIVTIKNLRSSAKQPCLLNLGPNEYYTFETNKNDRFLTLTVPDEKSLDSPYSLCSTINPWSPGNIISSVDQFYPNLNRLFPYDNQQEIKLWFANRYSKPIPNNMLSGYIELELIIDNLNNFAMDD